ncbi:hypothetical protein EIB18_01145 [Caulobacter vibrioides]|nr:hypothetical protein CA608_01155 [Caulobacter vibrioides]AZH11446.1 hypothetical protein EIB18_01145 [Caulobacter vibrioides]PLR13091.1 hypothetical protein CVUC_07110 [Caulobacter vibrioides]
MLYFRHLSELAAPLERAQVFAASPRKRRLPRAGALACLSLGAAWRMVASSTSLVWFMSEIVREARA